MFSEFASVKHRGSGKRSGDTSNGQRGVNGRVAISLHAAGKRGTVPGCARREITIYDEGLTFSVYPPRVIARQGERILQFHLPGICQVRADSTPPFSTTPGPAAPVTIRWSGSRPRLVCSSRASASRGQVGPVENGAAIAARGTPPGRAARCWTATRVPRPTATRGPTARSS